MFAIRVSHVFLTIRWSALVILLAARPALAQTTTPDSEDTGEGVIEEPTADPSDGSVEAFMTLIETQDERLISNDFWILVDPAASERDVPPPLITHLCGAEAEQYTRELLEQLAEGVNDPGEGCRPCNLSYCTEGSFSCSLNRWHFTTYQVIAMPDETGQLRLRTSEWADVGYEEDDSHLYYLHLRYWTAIRAHFDSRVQSEVCTD